MERKNLSSEQRHKFHQKKKKDMHKWIMSVDIKNLRLTYVFSLYKIEHFNFNTVKLKYNF